MTRHHPATLPVATTVIRLLIVANWLYLACLLAMLAGTVVDPAWLLRALKFPTLAENPGVLPGVRLLICVGIVGVPLHLALLRRLAAMLGTVRAGEPFVPENARRVQAIAWILLGEQLLSLAAAGAGRWASTPAQPLHLGAGISPSGVLAVVVAFVVARVFAAGTALRDDLEGTV